jgi:hypothetical protein
MSTYNELWNNPRFLNKRVEEQIEYMDDLVIREDISEARKLELLNAAAFQFAKFKKQLTETLLNEDAN